MERALPRDRGLGGLKVGPGLTLGLVGHAGSHRAELLDAGLRHQHPRAGLRHLRGELGVVEFHQQLSGAHPLALARVHRPHEPAEGAPEVDLSGAHHPPARDHRATGDVNHRHPRTEPPQGRRACDGDAHRDGDERADEATERLHGDDR